MYYLNDHQFYEVVIKKEEPPYDFKIHVFLDNNRDENESKTLERDLITTVMRKLDTYGAINIKDVRIAGNPHH